jgi:undecaprenyl-diphosphatase
VSLWQSIILGLVQGLTEFLPISSSAHLVIFEKILNVEAHNNFIFDVLVHVGTLAAVVVFFRKRIIRMIAAFFTMPFDWNSDPERRGDFKLAWLIILGTFPAVIIGLLFKDQIEQAFAAPRWAASMLLVTAVILILTHWARDKGRLVNVPRATTIGLAQALAIMPGISRSGSTISMGLFSGMDKSEAAEFSFLLSIPAIAGAAVLEIPDFIRALTQTSLVPIYAIGAVVAAIVGYLSIFYLLGMVKKGKFFYFGVYCALVGILGILFL